MRIGLLGTLSKPIIDSANGGTEVFCYLLSQGLAKKGHTVFLFASHESHVPGVTIVPVSEKTRQRIVEEYLAEKGQDLSMETQRFIDIAQIVRATLKLKDWESRLDIIHDNALSFVTGAVSDLVKLPIVTTMHMPPFGDNPYMQVPPLIVSAPKNIYIPISKYQKEVANISNDVIYNGIDIDKYSFDDIGGDAMIWIGRISPNAPKGLIEALKISADTGKQFHFAGNITHQEYFQKEIKPFIGPMVKEVGNLVDHRAKSAFLGHAKLGLFPIQWEEPFGFVFVEAMACGTPLIAFARGSVPEIIEDGVTGFIVNSSETDKRGEWIVKKTGLEGIQEAVDRLYSLSEADYRKMRQASRKSVEERFTVERMVDNYEKMYERVLART